jgi:hypothetical protein
LFANTVRYHCSPWSVPSFRLIGFDLSLEQIIFFFVRRSVVPLNITLFEDWSPVLTRRMALSLFRTKNDFRVHLSWKTRYLWFPFLCWFK